MQVSSDAGKLSCGTMGEHTCAEIFQPRWTMGDRTVRSRTTHPSHKCVRVAPEETHALDSKRLIRRRITTFKGDTISSFPGNDQIPVEMMSTE